MTTNPEKAACKPKPLDAKGFNPKTKLPYGLQVKHVKSAMEDFIDFIGFVNTQLYTKNIVRLESMLMAANFSSMVGEFMGSNLPKYCSSIAKNQYHNGHPDIVPAGQFPDNSVQYSHDGIEIKASRYEKSWQGHNPEKVFLVVFVFESNGPRDDFKGISPKPFRFKMALGANLEKRDWKFAGRSRTSRRTITASVQTSGFNKMAANWIYMDEDMKEKFLPE
jgi:hypothetical protein